MSVDVNNLGKYLAKLTDQQLKAYAQMHKANPYVVSLASYEASNRKEKRDAQLAQQGQAPQSKVVDTAIANMAAPMPEDQGIAKLSAGNMNFADGGIVAFAGDGPSQLVKDNPAAMGVLAPLQKAVLTAKQQYEAAANSGDSRAAQLYLQQLSDAQSQLSAAAKQQFGEGAAAQAVNAAQEVSAPAAPAVAQTGTPPMPNAAQGIGQTAPNAQAGAASAPGIGAPAAAGLPAIGGLAAMRQNIANQQNFVDPAAAETAALSADLKAGAERRKQEFEDQVTKQGDVFKGREERLAKRESDLAGMKDQSLGLALLQAGAAMMSTPGGLAQAVGKGIDTGSKYYVAGMDKLRASQERLADARDRMEELRLNRDDMTARERRALSADIDRAQIEGRKLGIEGIRLAADVNEKRASDIFTKTVDLQKTAYEQAGANARAAMPTGEMRAAMMLGTGDTDAAKLESGLRKMQEITADKTGMAAVKLLAETNAKLLPGEPKVTMAELLASAREFSTLMYPPKASAQPTGKVFK